MIHLYQLVPTILSNHLISKSDSDLRLYQGATSRCPETEPVKGEIYLHIHKTTDNTYLVDFI